jgi:hypothetical protein
VTLPELYIDEDAQSNALIRALRSRGVPLLTTSEAGMSKQTDEEQLRFATSQNRVLLTSNIAEFARMHRDWLAGGKSHSGIILVRQQKWGPGELAQRIIRVLAQSPSMLNRLEFLSS